MPASQSPILVTGGTGRLGRLIVADLVRHGAAVRVLTARPAEAHALLGPGIDLAEGRFEDAGALAASLAGVEKLLLLSPVSATLASGQTAAIAAAERAGLRRIVKISGSTWTIDPSGTTHSGDAHAAAEARLAASPVESVALRPNAWMQTSLGPALARAAATGTLALPHGDTPVAFIDIGDIAAVAAQQLMAATVAPGPLILSGPRAVTGTEIAQRVTEAGGRTVQLARLAWADQQAQLIAAGVPEAHRANIQRFAVLMADGAAAPVSPTVERLLGRPARDVAAFIAETLAKPG